MGRNQIIPLFFLLLSACAVAGKQTREVINLPTSELPRKAEVKSVPFVPQTRDYCGPASLTMVMRWAGKNVTVQEVAPQVFTEGGKGTLQTDLISASRRNGLLAIPLEGMKPMLQEVAAGHPVIVLENFGFGFFHRWHYAVIYGYDLDSQQVLMHTGTMEAAHEYLNRFEWPFKQAEYWSLVVLPPDELSASAGLIEHLRAAAGIELAGQIDAAETSYKKILARWPNNLGALIGLGNVSYTKKQYAKSVLYLKRACKEHPESTEAKHNLAVAEDALKSNQ